MEPILILFATQTGTAEELAKEIHTLLSDEGLPATCNDVYDCDINILQKHTYCLLVASTWGEGDPPDDAEDFYNALKENPDFDLSKLQHAVFGLGDSAYEEFNECGKNFDRMLTERGSKPIVPRVDCDIDIDDPFELWSNQLLEIFKSSHLVAS